MTALGYGRNGRVETTVEHLESLSRLEERIQRAVDLIARLKAENRRLMEERDILKKAAAYFAKNPE